MSGNVSLPVDTLQHRSEELKADLKNAEQLKIMLEENIKLRSTELQCVNDEIAMITEALAQFDKAIAILDPV